MRVIIEKDEQGQYFVSTYTEQPGETNESMGMGESAQTEQAESGNRQQARDLNEALSIAGKMLESGQEDQGKAMFDQGLASTMPNKHGMGGVKPGM